MTHWTEPAGANNRVPRLKLDSPSKQQEPTNAGKSDSRTGTEFYEIYVPNRSSLNSDRSKNRSRVLSPRLEPIRQSNSTKRNEQPYSHRETNHTRNLSNFASPKSLAAIPKDDYHYLYSREYLTNVSGKRKHHHTPSLDLRTKTDPLEAQNLKQQCEQELQSYLQTRRNQLITEKRILYTKTQMPEQLLKSQSQVSLPGVGEHLAPTDPSKKASPIKGPCNPSIGQPKIMVSVHDESQKTRSREPSKPKKPNVCLEEIISPRRQKSQGTYLVSTNSPKKVGDHTRPKASQALKWLNYNFKVWEMEAPVLQDPLGLNALLGKHESSFEREKRKFQMLTKKLWEEERKALSKKRTEERFEKLMEMNIIRDVGLIRDQISHKSPTVI